MKILLANKFYYRRGGDWIYTMNVEKMLNRLSGDDEMEQGGAGGVYGLVLAAIAVYDGHVRRGGIFS